jgi:hypothetical protein
MARSTNAAAGSGHNSKQPLTDEEASALVTYYSLKILADEKVAAQKKADYDGARSAVNAHFKKLSADLGYTRKEFEAEVIDKMQMTETEYLNSEARRARLHTLAKLKPGEQIDLIDAINDTVDDAIAAEQNGYRAGRRADDPFPPDTLSTMFHTDWMRGYHAGQEYNGLQLVKAAEILARPAPGTLTAGEDPDEDDDDADLDPDSITAQARALAKSSWGPTDAEAKFEEADGGKTIRQPRAKAETQAAA